MIKNNQLPKIHTIEDPRGSLKVIEYAKDFNFNIKRIFFLDDIKSPWKRGFHAHADLNQILIMLRGSMTLVIESPPNHRKTYEIKKNNIINIPGQAWREMINIKPNSLICVLCDRVYSEDVVIKDYEEFKKRF